MPLAPATKAGTGVGLLGDTPARDYVTKLRLFNAFAAAELRQAIALLGLRPGMSVLDAGCGSGEALHLLAEAVGPNGLTIGVDLATAHVHATRQSGPVTSLVMQADLCHLPLQAQSTDVIWCANTLHHLRDPAAGLQSLISLLLPGGRLGLVQSALLPEMVFVWDSRLERKVNNAVRRYYQQRYGATERDYAGLRNMIGLLRSSRLADIRAHTLVIERIAPLSQADRDYILQAIFHDTWGERLKPYLDAADYEQMRRLCDPLGPEFALAREDFHFLQTLTVVSGQLE
jgi:SAM-dependent methyltransferase